MLSDFGEREREKNKIINCSFSVWLIHSFVKFWVSTSFKLEIAYTKISKCAIKKTKQNMNGAIFNY